MINVRPERVDGDHRSVDGWSVLGSGVDLDPHDLRRRRFDRSFDGELEGDGGGRAAVAAAEQSELDDVVTDREQFDVAAMGAEIRPDVVQRLLDAGGDVVRMQVVHQQQAGDEVVSDQGRQRLVVEAAELVEDGERPFQTAAVQISDEPDELFCPLTRHDPARRARVQQRVDPIPDGAKVIRPGWRLG